MPAGPTMARAAAPPATRVGHEPLDGGDLGTTLDQRTRHDVWLRSDSRIDRLTGENV